MVLQVLVFFTVLIPVVLYWYYQYVTNYWRNYNVPHLPYSFPLGHMENPLKRTITLAVHMQKLYEQLKRIGTTTGGGVFALSKPVYIPLDPDLIRLILTKDFAYFADRGIYYNEKYDPLSAHLFNVDGTKWRDLRQKLTPTFTSGKLKTMFETLIECTYALRKYVDEQYLATGVPFNTKELIGHYTTDVIGSCAFGLDCKSFEEPNSPFRYYGKRIFQSNFSRNVRMILALNLPTLSRYCGISIQDPEVSKFYLETVRKTLEYRRKNHVERKDFFQLLLDVKNSDGTALTFEQIAAQCFVFFAAGFETSSTLMSFVLYELARNETIQTRLRDEIEMVLKQYEGRITYDAVLEMKYLQQVIDEGFRMYPPAPLLIRTCTKDYVVPNGGGAIIPKGVRIHIPIYAIQMDEQYYPNPTCFDPERFTEEEKQKRHAYVHLPFGEGPRNCIGSRFGLMQAKVGLIALLRNYSLTVNDSTKVPFKYEPNMFLLSVQGGIWLNAHKLEIIK